MAKGFSLGGALDALKHELMDEEGTKPVKAETASPVSPAPAPMSQSAPSPIVTSAPINFSQAVTTSTGTDAPPDSDTLNLVRQEVFPATVNGHPSLYLEFSAMYEALRRPADVTAVLAALKVHAPNLTVDQILADLSAHITLLDQTTASAASTFENAARDRLGRIDAQIQELQDANTKAQQEIERHQKETGDRNSQIAAAQTSRASEESKIIAAKQRTEAAEVAVKNELQSMQELIKRLA